jgi:hypothetical protein
MQVESGQTQNPSPSRRPRGPQGLGETVACALGERADSGESIGGVAEEVFLKQWLRTNDSLFPDGEWGSLKPISSHTSEHEVRYRISDHRAIKRTWPGTFGNLPKMVGGHWQPSPATPREYLHRWALQNELFGDEVRLEGGMLSNGPSMILGQPPDGLSLVISQPWLDAVDKTTPHPDEFEISDLLKERGFEPIFRSLYGWRHRDEGIIVLDAKPDNFIKTNVGILPIDLLLAEIFPWN